jgi:hypothetical protein
VVGEAPADPVTRAPWSRSLGSRTAGLLVLLVVVGVPAALLRSACAGSSCAEPAEAGTTIPFCSLPESDRRLIENGFREGRSPDLFVIDGSSPAYDTGVRVPLVFAGVGVASWAEIEDGSTLDRVAPTISEIIGLPRAHPEVRSGVALDRPAQSGDGPRLVLEVVWKGGDADQLQASAGEWPYLQSMMESGAGSLEASPGSLPLDPAAVLTTIGTGGVPSQHGITGSVIRGLSGRAVRAWGRGAPTSVIATLADDLDERMGQMPRIGIFETARSDRGLIGGNWYLPGDRDDFITAGPRVGPAELARLLQSGYGRDDVPDLVAVVVEGAPADVDAQLSALAKAANAVSNGSLLIVFTATGPDPKATDQHEWRSAIDDPDVIEATVPGGIFLDQERLAVGDIAEDEVVAALSEDLGTGNEVFTETAITFSRYC